MRNCIFCKIINKKEPAKIIYEDKDVICFLPNKVEVYGHTLIASKKHYVDLYDIPEDILSKLVRVAKKLTLSYRKKINATGANLIHASGIDGEQSVFHFHFHLLPRFKNDGLSTWPKLPKIKVDRDDLLKKLK
ncbi:MAG: HIT domain-containing protein [Patescibacteria group bacterium]